MKLLITVVILITVFFETNAQEVYIYDSKTGLPLDGVIIKNDKIGVQTDSAGKVRLDFFGEREILLIYHPSYASIRTDKRKISSHNCRLGLSEVPFPLEEIIVSVNRRPEKQTEITNKLVLIDQEFLNIYQSSTTANLLSNKGEVFIQKSQQGGGSPMIRGFSANRLLIVVDGIKMNNAIYRSGNLHNILSIDPSMIRETEILIGPGSVVYGSDAMGGVMNISTINPKLSTSDFRNKSQIFSAGFSSANMSHTLHGVSQWGNNTFGFLASATWSSFSDMAMGKNGPDENLRLNYVNPDFFNGRDSVVINDNFRKQVYSGYSQLNLMTKMRYRLEATFDLIFGAHYSATGNIPRYDRLIVSKNGRLRYGDWFYGPQNWMMINVMADCEPNKVLFNRMLLAAGFQNAEESRHDRNIDSPLLFHHYESVKAFTLNTDFTKSFTQSNSLAYGFEIIHNRVNSSGMSENLLNGN